MGSQGCSDRDDMMTHSLPHHLKLIGTSDQLGMLAVPQIIAAHEMKVLVPARVWALHG